MIRRNDFLASLDIIEKFRAEKRKNRRRFYFWYDDTTHKIIPVEILRISRVDDEECETRYDVCVRYQHEGDDTWFNRFVYAGDLFNSRKELVEEMIIRKEEEMEEFQIKVQEGCWVPQYDENVKRDLTALETWNKMKGELGILQNLR